MAVEKRKTNAYKVMFYKKEAYQNYCMLISLLVVVGINSYS